MRTVTNDDNRCDVMQATTTINVGGGGPASSPHVVADLRCVGARFGKKIIQGNKGRSCAFTPCHDERAATR
jgi:hypothetical protein